MTVLAKLIAAGVDPELVAEVAEAIAQARVSGTSTASERTKRQERNARYYDKHLKKTKSDDIKTPLDAIQTVKTFDKTVSDDQDVASRAREIEISNLNSKSNPYLKDPLKGVQKGNGFDLGKPKTVASEIETVISHLRLHLCRETAEDLVAHRKALKSPLSPGSAKSLAKKLHASGNAENAAQTMMANGWKGFYPEKSHQSRAGPRLFDRPSHVSVIKQDFYSEPAFDLSEPRREATGARQIAFNGPVSHAQPSRAEELRRSFDREQRGAERERQKLDVGSD